MLANIILYIQYISRLISSLHSQLISFNLLINIITIIILARPKIDTIFVRDL